MAGRGAEVHAEVEGGGSALRGSVDDDGCSDEPGV